MAATSNSKQTKPKASLSEFLEKDRKAAEERKAKKEVDMTTTPVYRCVRCGIATMKPNDQFYKSLASTLYSSNQGFAPICKNCVKELYEEALKETGQPMLAVELCCHYLDWPYISSMARSALDSNMAYPLSDYAKNIAFPKYNKFSFGTTLIKQLQSQVSDTKARAEQEKRWPSDSLRNMGYVKNIVGYDPFSDETYTSADRRFLFDTMAGYCPDDSIRDDSHKLQSIMTIVQLHLQAHKIGEQIFQELNKPSVDTAQITSLTNTQKYILQTINSTAKENAISAGGHGGVKAANTLTERMQKILNEGFEDIEVNMFDIEQSKAFQEIAAISLRSTLSELRFEENDYSEIVTEQLERIEVLTKERDEALEKLRLLENKELIRQQEMQE